MKNCCFTGHRNITDVRERLEKEIKSLITEKGITDFFCGGALGFDTEAGLAVIALRKEYPYIRLHLVLPCSPEEQSGKWDDEQKETYRILTGSADSIESVSEKYCNGCMKKRNAKLVEYADICLCCLNEKRKRSGTAQTVNMAVKKNIPVINLYE